MRNSLFYFNSRRSAILILYLIIIYISMALVWSLSTRYGAEGFRSFVVLAYEGGFAPCDKWDYNIESISLSFVRFLDTCLLSMMVAVGGLIYGIMKQNIHPQMRKVVCVFFIVAVFIITLRCESFSEESKLSQKIIHDVMKRVSGEENVSKFTAQVHAIPTQVGVLQALRWGLVIIVVVCGIVAGIFTDCVLKNTVTKNGDKKLKKTG